MRSIDRYMMPSDGLIHRRALNSLMLIAPGRIDGVMVRTLVLEWQQCGFESHSRRAVPHCWNSFHNTGFYDQDPIQARFYINALHVCVIVGIK